MIWEKNMLKRFLFLFQMDRSDLKRSAAPFPSTALNGEYIFLLKFLRNALQYRDYTFVLTIRHNIVLTASRVIIKTTMNLF